MKQITSIIVAAGSGKRMGEPLPKQFLELGGRAILMRTIENMYSAIGEHQVVVVLPNDYIDYWHKLCQEQNFVIPHQVVGGGADRFFSVKNGVDLVNQASQVVLVHDGVRPFVSSALVNRVVDAAMSRGAVVPTLAQIDSIRQLMPNGESSIVDRSLYKRVQTPQGFSASLLRLAYEQPFSPLFTDDASVVESLGEKILLVDGEEQNIKITTSFDMLIGETIINK